MLRSVCGVVLILGVASGTFGQARDPVNCLVVFQYNPDTTPAEQQNGTASNEDLMESAKVLAGSLGDARIQTVTSTTTLEQALQKLMNPSKGKKSCCKKLVIVAHGAPKGALDFPYDLPDPNSEINNADLKRDPLFRHELGGPAAETGWGRDRLKEFRKSVKAASCPNEPVTIDFDACYSAVSGGVAERVGKIEGFKTTGFTGVCDFGFTEEEGKRKQWHAPRPKKGTTSEVKSFP